MNKIVYYKFLYFYEFDDQQKIFKLATKCKFSLVESIKIILS